MSPSLTSWLLQADKTYRQQLLLQQGDNGAQWIDSVSTEGSTRKKISVRSSIPFFWERCNKSDNIVGEWGGKITQLRCSREGFGSHLTVRYQMWFCHTRLSTSPPTLQIASTLLVMVTECISPGDFLNEDTLAGAQAAWDWMRVSCRLQPKVLRW